MLCNDSERVQYFNGLRFVQGTDRRYFKCHKINMGMHRYVWEYYNGPIPEGYVIHHKDSNKANNDISNLECIPRGTHSRLHGAQLTDEEREWKRNNLNTKARPKAIEWHKSKEGKQWHKQQSQKLKEEGKLPLQPFVEHTCEQCGKIYQRRRNTSKKICHTFCSGACAQKYRRVHKIDTIEKECPVCGKLFKTSKYGPALTCGHSCADKLRWQDGGIFADRKRKGNA